MQSRLAKLLVFLMMNLIVASRVYATAADEQRMLIEEELQTFSRTLCEFSFKMDIDAPEKKFAFFETTLIIDFFTDAVDEFIAESLIDILGSWLEHKEEVCSSHLNTLDKNAIKPFLKENSKLCDHRWNVWRFLKIKIEDKKLILKPLEIEARESCQANAKEALSTALANKLDIKEAIYLSRQASIKMFLNCLNKYAKIIIANIYEAGLVEPFSDLALNPFSNFQTWMAMWHKYFSPLPPEALFYFKPWKITLDAFVFREHYVTFLLGRKDHQSQIAALPPELVAYILKIGS